MNRYAVFGAGMMGRVIAQDLVETEADAQVTLFDLSDRLLEEARSFVGSDRLAARVLNVTDRADVLEALRGKDVALGALPHGVSLSLVEAAVEAGTSLVDLVGSDPEKRAALHGRAKDNNCLVVPECGVAPGISNMCVGQGVELLDETLRAIIYVGGIPRRKRPPLFYETVYLMESVLNACERPVTIIEDGERVTVEPLTGLELITFPEPIGELEAYYTDGLASLPLTMRGKIQKKLSEKTLRYPGHVERIRTLKECGLLGTTPIRIGGVDVAPRDLLLALVAKDLELGPEGDILAMRVIVDGMKGDEPSRQTFELVDTYDPGKNHTAMARTTGFPATITARMIANGDLGEKGVFFPEQIFIGPRFESMAKKLSERGIRITHTDERREPA